MTSRTRLSVVIPVKNEADRIGRCLEALAAQQDPVDETIVVDNGSTDDTAKLALATGARVIVEPHPGISASRAAGFDIATGDVIARIDADTVVAPYWATAIRTAFDDDAGLDGLAGGVRLLPLSHPLSTSTGHAYEAFRALHRRTMGAGPLLYGHNMALRASAWRRIRGLITLDDKAISEDIDIALAILTTGGRIRAVGEVTATIDVLRTIRPGKLIRYARRDALTRRKYSALARSHRSDRPNLGATAIIAHPGDQAPPEDTEDDGAA